jgi:hypothetical protein
VPRRRPCTAPPTPLLAVFLAVLAVLVAAALLAPPAAADEPDAYVPPVDAPVADPFRAPTTPYGPGNRGLLYGTERGTPVRAAAAGTVAFAGSVAGSRHVTVEHADGLRTTYSFLDELSVVVGERIDQGDVVGTTAGQLHFGVRSGDAYLDPASLFGDGLVSVHLVPFDLPIGDGQAGERSAIRQLIGGLGGLGRRVGEVAGAVAERAADHVLAGTGATVDWLREEGPQVLRTAIHYLERRLPVIGQVNLALSLLDAWSRARSASTGPCTAEDVAVAPPGDRRVALLVGGLGSTSESAAIDDLDTAALGYAEPDVLRYSYAGGRTPDASDGFDHIEANAYDPTDSQRDLRAAGADLADLVEEVATGGSLEIDLYAHSQGGIVVRLTLIELERRHGAAWLSRLGLVATLGTPHGGADAATAVHGIGSTRRGSTIFDVAGAVIGLDDDAPSAAQLAESSDVVAELAETRIPEGVHAVSIAARGDLVVPVPRTAARGAEQVVVPLSGLHAHDALPGSPEAQRELQLALAGRPPGCRSFGDAFTDQLVGLGVSELEDSIGAVAWVAAGWRGAFLGG